MIREFNYILMRPVIRVDGKQYTAQFAAGTAFDGGRG
jgi:hypothetical protein